MEFSLSGEVYKLELVKAFRDQWEETSGEYTPEGDMPPLYQANKKNPKSINDINFKNWLWREYHIKLEDIILLESQLNENLALAFLHQNKIGITHTSDGIRITEENKCDPVIQKEIYEDWKKNSGQYDPKNDVIPEWEMDALHPRTVNDMKFEQYLLREYGMTRKEEIEKTFGGNIDALLKMSTIFDVFTLGTAAVAKLTGKKVWKKVGEEVGEKAVKAVAGETREILEKELVEQTTDDVAKIVTKVEGGSGTTPTEKELKDAVNEWVRMEERLANSKRQLDKFNTATVVYDSRTGNYYYGMNKGVQRSGDILDQSLAKMLPETSLNQYKVGNCAEVDAVNQAIKAGANIKDLQIYTINTKTGLGKPMCKNCIYTFEGKVSKVFTH